MAAERGFTVVSESGPAEERMYCGSFCREWQPEVVLPTSPPVLQLVLRPLRVRPSANGLYTISHQAPPTKAVASEATTAISNQS
jgi:hypothetical protein